MKQYKFKYKGKWHDILCAPCGKFKGEAIADTCFGTPDEYHFRVLESSLPKLLATLRKLNIEVAEVCDKLRWRHLPEDESYCERYESPAVLANGKTFVYAIVPSGTDCFIVLCNDAPLICRSEVSLKAAKAACQDDFNKRRAR